jgi:hypothetical protein
VEDDMERGSSYNNENLKATIQSTTFVGSNATEKCEIFQLIGSVITNDVGYTLQIKFNNAMAKEAEGSFAGKFDFNLGKKLVKS